MQYVGDFTKGSEVFLTFDTNAKAGGSIGATIPVGSVRVFKNGDAGSYDTAGVGISANFSGSTGIHRLDIDTSGAFYERRAEYVVLLVGATVDGESVNAVLGQFSIENRNLGLSQVHDVDSVVSTSIFTLDSDAPAIDGLFAGMVAVPVDGQLQGIPREVIQYVGSTRQVEIAPAYPAAIDATAFELIGIR